MKQLATSIIIIFFTIHVKSQTVESILNKYEEQLIKTESAFNNITYTLYEDYKSNKVLEQVTGISVKDKNQYYTKMGLTEFVFNPTYTLKISNAERIIVITDPSLDDSTLNKSMVSSMLEQFDSESVKDKGAFWECSFISKENSKQPYSKCVLHISKNEYQMVKQILYFSSTINHNYKEKDPYTKNQRLEIEFKDFTKKDKFLKEKMSLSTYVSLVGSEYKPKDIVNNYTVINALTKQLK